MISKSELRKKGSREMEVILYYKLNPLYHNIITSSLILPVLFTILTILNPLLLLTFIL
jgi:hypothetical protein